MITVNSRKYDGSIRRSWRCELLESRDSLLVFVGEFDSDIEHPDLGLVRKGTVSYEYYWLDRWYNVFRFHEPTGELRFFYCNINMPPQWTGDVLDYVDLDIDVLVHPDLTYDVLDRADYQINAALYGYPPELNEKVEATLNELIEIIERRELPDLPKVFATSTRETRESG